MLEAGVLVYYELASRPKELHWAPWLEGQRQKARQALDALEVEVRAFGPEIDLGQICVGVALGWRSDPPLPRGQFDYAAIAVTCVFNSNSIGLT